MIEYVIFGILALTFLLILLFFAYILYRKQENLSEIAYNKYKIERKKLLIEANKKTKGKQIVDDDAEDFIDSLPNWLSSIAQGANIDLEAVYEGDPDELRKVKDILDKNLPKQANSPDPEAPLR
jgi:hypothetical protein